MAWQDIIFLTGAAITVGVLYPTLSNKSASVPWATSIPAALLKVVFGVTFLSMDMLLSAVGMLVAAGMWGLIAFFRHPAVTNPVT
ncbi:hypothetical protein [Haloarcula nitratireducens]|uniref:Uncharacterized protein n=1 Tax=Haloarcula nitratireducens TaxID=2487749 RepID=A0AAW4P693_9EURY|nr:hypothetical protein [Halomicroarcula nitratireducens]MBX0293490.1 hypothetical protein [Halomicroarcula nitratireducens]